MRQIHDKGYKRLLKNKGIFQQLIETFVELDWVKDLNFDECECLEKSFISEQYKETISDIVHKIKLKHRDLYIIILTELKSTVERFASLDIANYITNFYKDYLAANKKIKNLPVVFPILLYNGNRRWTAPTKLSDLIEGSKYFNQYSIDVEYYKIAINEYDKDELLQKKNVASTLFLAEAHYDPELLADVFLEVFEREKDKGPISLLLNWFAQLAKHGRIPKEDYDKLEHVYHHKEEVQEMLITAIKKEKKEIYTKGKAEGKAEGKSLTQIEVAKRMLARGFEVSLVSELTGLPAQKILKLTQQMAE